MTKILFICHGNICRSPMAEYIFNNMVRELGLEDKFEVASAATSREEIGNDIYPPAKKCLERHGIPFSKHRARQITKSDIEYFDHIIVMEEYNIRNMERMFGPVNKCKKLLDFADKPGDIPDPWYTGDFEKAYEEIERGCKGIIWSI